MTKLQIANILLVMVSLEAVLYDIKYFLLDLTSEILKMKLEAYEYNAEKFW